MAVRDFVDPGWPLMYAVSASARALFGRELWVELLVVASAFAIGAAFTLATAARLSGSVIVALLVTLLEVGFNPRSFGYPKLLLYAIAGWMLVAAARRISYRAPCCSAHSPSSPFCSATITACTSAPARWQPSSSPPGADGTRVLVRRAATFAATTVVCLLPWAVFVQYHVGLIDVSEPGLEFSRAEAEATVLRSLPSLDLSGQSGRDADQLGSLAVLPVLRDTCVSLVIAWSRAQRGHERWTGESAGVAAIAVMAVVMNLGFIRTPLMARLPDAGAPAAMLAAWLIGLAFDVRATTFRRVVLTAAAVLFAVTARAVSVVADVPGELNRAGVLNRRGAMVERIADLTARLCQDEAIGKSRAEPQLGGADAVLRVSRSLLRASRSTGHDRTVARRVRPGQSRFCRRADGVQAGVLRHGVRSAESHRANAGPVGAVRHHRARGGSGLSRRAAARRCVRRWTLRCR